MLLDKHISRCFIFINNSNVNFFVDNNSNNNYNCKYK